MRLARCNHDKQRPEVIPVVEFRKTIVSHAGAEAMKCTESHILFVELTFHRAGKFGAGKSHELLKTCVADG